MVNGCNSSWGAFASGPASGGVRPHRGPAGAPPATRRELLLGRLAGNRRFERVLWEIRELGARA